MTLRVGSFCSGIAAPEVAWKPLGFVPQFFSEIEPFPCAVLEQRHAGVPNLGNMESITDEQIKRFDVSVLVAGTPCQSFSVAGLRGGMADPRGNLALVFLRLVDWSRPRWVVWENVPGVLSSRSGEPEGAPPDRVGVVDGEQFVDTAEYDETDDFRCFTAALTELGYGWAYRVLDAQFYGVAQRRRRVFVVGCLGEWRGAAAVLFERDCLSGNPAPSREAGTGSAREVAASLRSGGAGTSRVGDTRGQDNVVSVFGGGNVSGERSGDTALTAHGRRQDFDSETFVAHSLRAEGFDASEDGTGRGTPIIPINMQVAVRHQSLGESTGLGIGNEGDPAFTIQREHHHAVAIPLQEVGKRESKKQNGAGIGIGSDAEPMYTLQAGAQHGIAYQCHGSNVGEMGTLRSGNGNETGGVPFTLAVRGREGEHRFEYRQDGVANAILTPNGGRAGIGVGAVNHGMAVRRLTPRECERLQGFPDDYTAITFRGKPAADGPRYRALGNSMAVPVLRWIGERILRVDALAPLPNKERTSP